MTAGGDGNCRAWSGFRVFQLVSPADHCGSSRRTTQHRCAFYRIPLVLAPAGHLFRGSLQTHTAGEDRQCSDRFRKAGSGVPADAIGPRGRDQRYFNREPNGPQSQYPGFPPGRNLSGDGLRSAADHPYAQRYSWLNRWLLEHRKPPGGRPVLQPVRCRRPGWVNDTIALAAHRAKIIEGTKSKGFGAWYGCVPYAPKCCAGTPFSQPSYGAAGADLGTCYR